MVPIYHTLHTEFTPRIYWFLHHTFFHHTNKSIRTLPIIINLLTFVLFYRSSIRCLVPVRFSITNIYSSSILSAAAHRSAQLPYNHNEGKWPPPSATTTFFFTHTLCTFFFLVRERGSTLRSSVTILNSHLFQI